VSSLANIPVTSWLTQRSAGWLYLCVPSSFCSLCGSEALQLVGTSMEMNPIFFTQDFAQRRATAELPVFEFHGTKCIHNHLWFLHQFNLDTRTPAANLVECGRRLGSLMGPHHCHCWGGRRAFFMQDDRPF
jgi:hypothetical protein